jgi:hypothetical protein
MVMRRGGCCRRIGRTCLLLLFVVSVRVRKERLSELSYIREGALVGVAAMSLSLQVCLACRSSRAA